MFRESLVIGFFIRLFSCFSDELKSSFVYKACYALGSFFAGLTKTSKVVRFFTKERKSNSVWLKSFCFTLLKLLLGFVSYILKGVYLIFSWVFKGSKTKEVLTKEAKALLYIERFVISVFSIGFGSFLVRFLVLFLRGQFSSVFLVLTLICGALMMIPRKTYKEIYDSSLVVKAFWWLVKE